jgi:hypothetical protein
MDSTTNERQVEQQAEGGEVEIARGPFDSEAEAREKAPADKSYKLWETRTPESKVVFTYAKDAGRGLIAAARGLGWKTSLVGGKKKAVTAADVSSFLAQMTPEERAEYLAQYLPKGGKKGGKQQ